jgi:hypothetical protein
MHGPDSLSLGFRAVYYYYYYYFVRESKAWIASMSV